MVGNEIGGIMTEEELKKIHDGCSNHKEALQNAKLCGCFYCSRTYGPSEINEWIDGGDTALCPRCSIDSVIPLDDSVDNASMLEAMSMYWFNLEYNEDGQLVHKWSG
jgi:hypothetical protein